MALVISSFIAAPLAIILSILIFLPPFLTGLGQQQDIVVSAKTGLIQGFTEGPMGTGGAGWVKIVPSSDAEKFNVTMTKPIEGGDTIFVDKAEFQVQYVPAGETRTIKVIEGQPVALRFFYVNAAPAAPFDVTGMIITVISVSSAVAGAWLFIGIKEYRFFANWNRSYSNDKEMQDKVDKALDEG